jgi:2-dehydropantoate 2-reductase
MRLLVLGAGAVGGYFGGRLVQAGADVTFLVRSGRRQALERDGLRVHSPLGDIASPVATISSAELASRGDAFDLILLTCKSYDLEPAMEAIAPAVRGDCGIVPLLNGVTHLARLDQRFGESHVLGGTCSINVAARPDGSILHVGTLQRLAFGERGRGSTARAAAFAAALGRTSIDWHWSEHIAQELWDKLVLISTLATVTCLFRANLREIHAAPGGRDAIERAFQTNVAVAAAEGLPPAESAIGATRAILFNADSPADASLMRDMEAGNQVESEPIVGWMLQRARAHGLDDTLLSLAYTQLKAYEERRRAGRLPVTAHR